MLRLSRGDGGGCGDVKKQSWGFSGLSGGVPRDFLCQVSVVSEGCGCIC